MAEYTHDSAIGSWYFQAVVASAKLDRMTKNTRAAHWNKPRAVRYRQSANIGGTQTADTEDTHQCLLSGVRVIQGPAQLAYPSVANPADVNAYTWIGDPQVMFPTGQGLPPFVLRPIVTANAVNFEIQRTAPLVGLGLRAADDQNEDYTFVNWFGGLDWGGVTGTTPEGISYQVNDLFGNDAWIRAVVARPIPESNSGEAGPYDLTVGLRFRLIFGRLGGSYTHPGSPLAVPDPRGYYIHWQAMGPVAVY